MLRFLLTRLLSGLATVWFIATATFAAMHAVPGDPLLNARAVTPEVRLNMQRHYGLDKPLAHQYLIFLGNMARADFGMSFTQRDRRVNDIIAEHFAISARLGVLAIAIALGGGIVLGALSARWRGRWPDRLIMFAVVISISVPGFVFAAMGQLGILRLNGWLGFSLLPVAGWGRRWCSDSVRWLT
jgi:ABC-type dipeptide/oligopeptide/nickel transport system permease component